MSLGSDMLGVDVVTRFILEGHTKGVNWVNFHPTLPLIVSGSDDHDVRVWRLSDTRGWPVDTLHGHGKNVSAVLFHPKKDVIVSNAEDKSLRVWDVTKRSLPTVLYREHDRFWALDVHPTSGLLAAGHDGGFLVFKLQRERPPAAMLPAAADGVANTALLAREGFIWQLTLGATTPSIPIFACRRASNTAATLIRSLQVNLYSSTHLAVLLHGADGNFDLYVTEKASINLDKAAASSPAVVSPFYSTGQAKAVAFVSSTRFAVLDKSKAIHLRSLTDEAKRKITIPGATMIFPGGNGKLLVRCPDSLMLYDTNACRAVAELRVPARHVVKHVTWSPDFKTVAVQTKGSLYLADSRMQLLSLISEGARVKSVAWDRSGACIYSTHTHLKYALPSGESGPLRTIDDPLYLLSVADTSTPVPTPRGPAAGVSLLAVHALDRDQQAQVMLVSPAEFRFRLALQRRRAGEVKLLLRSGALMGDAIVDYVTQQGYPELALKFTSEPTKRFELALQAGLLDVATECAAVLDSAECWTRLAAAAMAQGACETAEAALVKGKDLSELALTYAVLGDHARLGKLADIAAAKRDTAAQAHLALLRVDQASLASTLALQGLPALAQACAPLTGRQEEVRALLPADAPAPVRPYLLSLADIGVHDDDTLHRVSVQGLNTAVPVPATLLHPPVPVALPVVAGLARAAWPLLPIQRGFDLSAPDAVDPEPVDALDAAAAGDAEADDDLLAWGAAATADPAAPADDAAMADADAEFEGEGWDIDGLDLDVPTDAVADAGAPAAAAGAGGLMLPAKGTAAADAWTKGVAVASAHVAAGRFDQAMRLMRTQLGITHFGPFKPLFVRAALYSSSTAPTLPGLPGLALPLHRAIEVAPSTSPDAPPALNAAPALRTTLVLLEAALREAQALVSRGLTAPAHAALLTVLLQAPITTVSSATEQTRVTQIMRTVKEYLLANRLERARTTGVPGVAPPNAARKAELAALASNCDLAPAHRILNLWLACKYMFQVKNLATVGSLCRSILELAPRADAAALAGKVDIEVVRKMLRKCEGETQDATQTGYKAGSDQCACSVNLTPVDNGAYAEGREVVVCTFCGAKACMEGRGQGCPVCEVTVLGETGTGIKLF